MNSRDSSDKNNSYWAEKPLWCQPWTILVTGITLIIVTNYLFRNILVVAILGVIIICWWLLFLVIAPVAYLKEAESDEL